MVSTRDLRKLFLRIRQRLLGLSPGVRWRNRRYRRRAAGRFPIPPDHLLVQVAGSADARWFIEGGLLAFQSIRATLEDQRIALAELGAVFDFGCGCGRVLRHWDLSTNPSLHGTDFNASLIEWCKANLPIARYQVNGLTPPLDYPSDYFDLVYALSVFTHLPASLQTAWVDELARILLPGGVLLITVHGEHYMPQLTLSEQARFRAGHLVVRNEALPGSNFCTAFHPAAFVRNHLAGQLELLVHVPEAAAGNPFQDIVLLQKPHDT